MAGLNNDDLSALFVESLSGRDTLGGEGPLGGLFELLIGQLTGQNTLMPTQSTGQYDYTREMSEQLRKLVDVTTNQDQRWGSILHSIGNVAGGEQMGQGMANFWEGLPPFAKQMLTTAINQTEFGAMLGGDTGAIIQGSLSLARSGAGLSDHVGMGAAMGDILDPMRESAAETITTSVMEYFTDGASGLPVLERTQGQSLDTIGKLLDHMQQEGGVRTDQLIDSVDTDTGTVNFNSGELNKLNQNLSKGAELFRNLTDVFGSRDFNELLNQAKRLGGLNLQDPSSIGRALSSVRDARGIAQAVGGDERRMLGIIAQHADTFTQVTGLHNDPALGTIASNVAFRGAAMQAAADRQSYTGASNIFSRTASLEERMQNSVTSYAMQIQEAKQNPGKSYAKIYQLKTFLDQNRNMVDDDTASEIENALSFQGDADQQDELLNRAVGKVYDQTGIQLSRTQQLTGVDFRFVSDDTKKDILEMWDNRQANLNTRLGNGRLGAYMDSLGFDSQSIQRSMELEGSGFDTRKPGGVVDQMIPSVPEPTRQELEKLGGAAPREGGLFDDSKSTVPGRSPQLLGAFHEGNKDIVDALEISSGNSGKAVEFTNADGASHTKKVSEMSGKEQHAGIINKLLSSGLFDGQVDAEARAKDTAEQLLGWKAGPGEDDRSVIKAAIREDVGKRWDSVNGGQNLVQALESISDGDGFASVKLSRTEENGHIKSVSKSGEASNKGKLGGRKLMREFIDRAELFQGDEDREEKIQAVMDEFGGELSQGERRAFNISAELDRSVGGLDRLGIEKDLTAFADKKRDLILGIEPDMSVDERRKMAEAYLKERGAFKGDDQKIEDAIGHFFGDSGDSQFDTAPAPSRPAGTSRRVAKPATPSTTDQAPAESEAQLIAQGVSDFREILEDHRDIGYGLRDIGELMAIGEGKENAMVRVVEDGKLVRKSAKEMDAMERKAAILSRLQDMDAYHGKENQAELQQKAAERIWNYTTDTQKRAAAAGTRIGTSQQVINMHTMASGDAAIELTSYKALRDADRAADEGTLRLEGDELAATNPMANFLYGLVGGDRKKAYQKAFNTFSERDSTTETMLSTDKLTTTGAQRNLLRHLKGADTNSDKQRILETEGTEKSFEFAAAQAQYLKNTTVMTESGEKTLAQVLGIEDDTLEQIQSDAPLTEKVGAFTKIMDALGGEEGRQFQVINKLREAGAATTQDTANSAAMRKQLYATLGKDGEKKVKTSRSREKYAVAQKFTEDEQKKLDALMADESVAENLDAYEKQLAHVEELQKNIYGDGDKMLQADEVAKRNKQFLEERDKLLKMDPQGKLAQASLARDKVEAAQSLETKQKEEYKNLLKESGASEEQLTDLANLGWEEFEKKYAEDEKVKNVRQAIDSKESIITVSGEEGVRGQEELTNIMTYDRRKDVLEARKTADLAEKYGNKDLRKRSEVLRSHLDEQIDVDAEQQSLLENDTWGSDKLLMTLSGRTLKDAKGQTHHKTQDEVDSGIEELDKMGFSRKEILANLDEQSKKEGLTDDAKERIEKAKENVNSYFDDKESQGGGLFGLIRSLIERIADLITKIDRVGIGTA